ncbi:MAG: rod shape-determining protein MreD [Pseudomonadota bacterium]
MSRTGLWRERALFILLSLFCLYVPLLPLSTGLGRTILPDLFFLLACAWVLRRPDTAPLALIAGLAFLGDVMLNRPLGLWALATVCATELLRHRGDDPRERVFLGEWLTVSVLYTLGFCLFLFILRITLVPIPGNGAALQYWITTLLCYPFTAGLLQFGLRVRPTHPAERWRQGAL